MGSKTDIELDETFQAKERYMVYRHNSCAYWRQERKRNEGSSWGIHKLTHYLQKVCSNALVSALLCHLFG